MTPTSPPEAARSQAIESSESSRTNDRRVESVLGRILTDEEFRHQFYANPETACRENAFELTSDEIAAILNVDQISLSALAADLDQKIVRASGGSVNACSITTRARR